MPDRENLMDGLHCRATNFPEKDCAHCHYGIQMGRRWGCDFRRMTEDAIALLEAQEPKPVHVTAIINNRKIGECPNCGKPINSGDYPRYCGDCGQAVKWE